MFRFHASVKTEGGAAVAGNNLLDHWQTVSLTMRNEVIKFAIVSCLNKHLSSTSRGNLNKPPLEGFVLRYRGDFFAANEHPPRILLEHCECGQLYASIIDDNSHVTASDERETPNYDPKNPKQPKHAWNKTRVAAYVYPRAEADKREETSTKNHRDAVR